MDQQPNFASPPLAASAVTAVRSAVPAWTFLSNHMHVLVCIAREPEIRLRDIALQVGITERMVQRLVAELVDEGYLLRTRQGRRNVYVVYNDRPLRHPLEAGCTIGKMLELLRDADMLRLRSTP